MKKILAIIFIFNSYTLIAQDGTGRDSTAFLDSIYNEMDEILDELTASKNYLSLSVGAGTGFFNFKSASSTTPKSQKSMLLSPNITFLHKSGFGIAATGYAVSKDGNMNPYQLSVSPSYDYIKRGNWALGFAYTRYFTKKDPGFYTTPIRNETYAYFNYRRPWLQPGIAIGYGWGSRTQYEEQEMDVLRLRQLRDPFNVTVRKDESIRDISLLLSVRHSFDWSALLFSKDLLTITPVILLSSGTQNFGFNTSFQSQSKTLNNFLPGNQYISNKPFDTQSASFVLRADYAVGKFFIQTQGLLDYFLHHADNRLNNAFAIIGGVNF